MSSMFDLFPLQVLNISDLGGIGNLAIFRMIYFGVVLKFSYKHSIIIVCTYYKVIITVRMYFKSIYLSSCRVLVLIQCSLFMKAPLDGKVHGVIQHTYYRFI